MLSNILGKFFKVGAFSTIGLMIAETLTNHSSPVNSWEDVGRIAIAAALTGGIAAAERWKNFDVNKLGR